MYAIVVIYLGLYFLDRRITKFLHWEVLLLILALHFLDSMHFPVFLVKNLSLILNLSKNIEFFLFVLDMFSLCNHLFIINRLNI